MARPLRSLPRALPTQAQDRAPTASGEYPAVRVSPRPSPAVPPSGRYGTAPESRRVLDEYDFDVRGSRGALELEDERRRRSSEPTAPASFTRAGAAPPRRTTSSPSILAIDPHAMLVAYAGFGADPTSIWATPRYALNARRRRRSLLRELEIARKHKPQEVGTIEAALRTMDAIAVQRGSILLAAYTCLGVASAVVGAWLVNALL